MSKALINDMPLTYIRARLKNNGRPVSLRYYLAEGFFSAFVVNFIISNFILLQVVLTVIKCQHNLREYQPYTLKGKA